jgi:hypothetical protein
MFQDNIHLGFLGAWDFLKYLADFEVDQQTR